MRRCIRCGRVVTDDTRFCPSCGNTLFVNQCEHCGSVSASLPADEGEPAGSGAIGMSPLGAAHSPLGVNLSGMNPPGAAPMQTPTYPNQYPPPNPADRRIPYGIGAPQYVPTPAYAYQAFPGQTANTTPESRLRHALKMTGLTTLTVFLPCIGGYFLLRPGVGVGYKIFAAVWSVLSAMVALNLEGYDLFTRVVLTIIYALPVVVYPFREFAARKKKKEAKDKQTLIYAQLIANNPPQTYEEIQLEALEAKYEDK